MTSSHTAKMQRNRRIFAGRAQSGKTFPTRLAMAALASACFTGMVPTGLFAATPAAGSSSTNAAQQPVTAGPIIINSGGTYSETVESTDPTTPAITINTDQPVVITNSTIVGRGPLISIAGTGNGANVTITNTTGVAVDPGVTGKLRGAFVTANDVASLTVQNNSIYGVSFGIKVLSSNVLSLKIMNNLAENLEDRESNGQGGTLTARPDLGHFVILNAVSAPAGAEIGWNELVDVIGSSSTEDVINIYKSQGSQADPITVHDNYMEGYSSTTTPSYSGSGVVSDGDGTEPVTAFVLFENNDMVHTAGSGVEVASGHDITARGNRVVSCGQDANGNWFAMPFANAEIMWNYYGSQSPFYNNTIDGTAGGMVRPNTNGSPMIADTWVNTPDMTDNNSVSDEAFTDPCLVNGHLNLQAEETERGYWLNKVSTAGVVIGDQHESLLPTAIQ